MMNTPIPTELLDLIHQSQRVLCISHVSPDGDAYGSLLGMVWLLRHLGKQATPAMHDSLVTEFRDLPGAREILPPRRVDGAYDLVISLDASSADRMGDVYKPKKHGEIPLAVIDHHATNTRFGAVNWVAPECAATAQMVAYLADVLDVPLTGNIAECLLTGIVTDTLCFRTSNTTPAVLEVAMRLQAGGANLPDIVQRTLARLPFAAIQLWSLVMPDAQLEDGVVWATVRRNQLQQVGLKDNDSRLNTIMSTIIEADISAVFTEKIGISGQPAVECSFRAKPGFSVSELAFALGGGGHPPASGCTIEGPLDETIERVVHLLQDARRTQAAHKGDRQA